MSHFTLEPTREAKSVLHLTDVMTAGANTPLKVGISRSYRNVVTTSATINGRHQTGTGISVYEIAGRSMSDKLATQYGGDIACYPLTCEYPAFKAEEFASAAKKNHKFGGNFTYFDFAAIVETLGAAVAYYSIQHRLSGDVISGGAEARIRVLNMLTPDIIASNSSVFVTRMLDTQLCPSNFYALSQVCARTGSTIVTDMVTTDDQQRALLLPCKDGALAMACVELLLILAGQYASIGEESCFMYALARGLHSTLTVIGHTNEGGMTREVLRSGSFVPSYGGFRLNMEVSGLPRPISSDPANITHWVDTILLTTAAAVAACDPLTELDGRMYPTVYTSMASKEFDIETPEVLNSDQTVDLDAIDLGRQIAADYWGFACNYAKALGILMCGTRGSDAVATHMCAALSGRCGKPLNHLKYRAVAPYYWIEPTGLIHLSAADFPAVREGYCQIAEHGKKSGMRYMELLAVNANDHMTMQYTAKYKCARACGAVLFHSLSTEDGLANTVMHGMDPAKALFTGGGDDNTSPDAKFDKDADFAAYLWGRGHSAIPPPAEFMYLGRGIRFESALARMVDSGRFGSAVDTFWARADELEQTVTIEVSKLVPLPSSKYLVFNPKVTRCRTKQARALAAQRLFASRAVGRPVVNKSKCDLGLDNALDAVQLLASAASGASLEAARDVMDGEQPVKMAATLSERAFAAGSVPVIASTVRQVPEGRAMPRVYQPAPQNAAHRPVREAQGISYTVGDPANVEAEVQQVADAEDAVTGEAP
uniref:Capsid protein n=1 Tax=Phytophthora palustris toti-like virus 5-1 TaxID=2976316 RepID=A0A9E8YX16_9VIRU|nr:capsid protein [Phytophthora palustris toti-like virus 5-1]